MEMGNSEGCGNLSRQVEINVTVNNDHGSWIKRTNICTDKNCFVLIAWQYCFGRLIYIKRTKRSKRNRLDLGSLEKEILAYGNDYFDYGASIVDGNLNEE